MIASSFLLVVLATVIQRTAAQSTRNPRKTSPLTFQLND